MGKNQKHNLKKKIKIEKAGIKKSIKEEKKSIKSKLQYREVFKVDKETSLFEKILYWILTCICIGLCVFISRKGHFYGVCLYILIYGTIVLTFGAASYSFNWNGIKWIYIIISKPLRIVFTYAFKFLGIQTSVQYMTKCFTALVISSFLSLSLLKILPNFIPLFKKVIISVFSNAESAVHMCIVCIIIACILCGMLLMYVLLKSFLVVFVVGDRNSKLKIFEEVWKEMKLLFYLATTVLQFGATANDIIGAEGNYLFEAVVLIMLVDEYREKCKE